MIIFAFCLCRSAYQQFATFIWSIANKTVLFRCCGENRLKYNFLPVVRVTHCKRSLLHKKTCSTRGYVSTLHCRGFVNSSSLGCCRFCRITSNLVSIYTKGRAGRSSVEISESFASSTSLERSYALWHEGSCLFLTLITPNLHTRVRRRGNVD